MGLTMRITCLVTLSVGLFYLASQVSADVTITATPAMYMPGEGFDIRCDLGGDAGTVEDIHGIYIGISVNENRILMAGISNDGLPQLKRYLRTRASVSGVLNHTHILQSYLTTHMNITTCSDVGIYYCQMHVKNEFIVFSAETTLNYTTLAKTEECQQLTLPPSPSTSATDSTISISVRDATTSIPVSDATTARPVSDATTSLPVSDATTSIPATYFTDTVNGGLTTITVTATPAVYTLGKGFDIRCDLRGDASTLDSVYTILIGISGTEEKWVAEISNQGLLQVRESLRARASASGVLNNTHILESYLTFHMDIATCDDVGVYYCQMTIKTGVILFSLKQGLNFTTSATKEECEQLTLSPVTSVTVRDIITSIPVSAATTSMPITAVSTSMPVTVVSTSIPVTTVTTSLPTPTTYTHIVTSKPSPDDVTTTPSADVITSTPTTPTGSVNGSETPNRHLFTMVLFVMTIHILDMAH